MSQDEWKEVQREFRERHPDMQDGDLLASLKDELPQKSQAKLADILRSNGVDCWPKDNQTRAAENDVDVAVRGLKYWKAPTTWCGAVAPPSRMEGNVKKKKGKAGFFGKEWDD